MTRDILRADARALALGDSTNTNLSDTDCDRYLNQYYRQAGEIAVENGGDWDPFGEIVSIDIVEDANNEGYIQQEYLLTDTDVNLRRIAKVFIRTSATEDYAAAKKVDITKLEQDFTEYEPSSPEYDLLEDSLFIFLSNYTYSADITAGIKAYCSTDITELSQSGHIPQLPTVIHKYLSVGAAFEHCQANELYAKADRLEKRLDKLEAMIATHYASRGTAKQLLMEPEEEFFY
jgi:hypothetical protein